MDEPMLLKMLGEINSMTSAEYWEFLNESQKLSDSLLDWEPVPVMAAITVVEAFNNISFSTEYLNYSEVFGNSRYSESEDMVCFQAA